MPNKRNPDVVELMRGTYASVAAAKSEIEHLLSLPSGYHRDLQVTKGALFHGFGKGLQALALLPDLLRRMQWNPEAMRAALDPRSEEHTSELQSLMRISYAVFCLKKKNMYDHR